MIVWLAVALAAEPAPVRVVVSDEVSIDWTRLVLQVTTSAVGRGVGATRKAVEHDARQEIEPAVYDGVRKVRVTPELTVDDLLDGGATGLALETRTRRWFVSEARYFASGRVELVAELSLQELLKPWTLSVARLAPASEVQPSYTGLLVDARGTGAVPAFAPRVVHGGDVLWDGVLWDEIAVFQTPAVWVSDPAHPAAARAGQQPLIVRAVAARGAELELDTSDAVMFRTGLRDARLLGEGTVVVVVDP